MDRASICFETLQLFAAVYGAEAGNLALKVLAHGGIYMGGGIAPKILKTLRSGAFTKGFWTRAACPRSSNPSPSALSSTTPAPCSEPRPTPKLAPAEVSGHSERAASITLA